MKHFGICEFCGKKTEYKYKSWIKRFCSFKCSNQWKWNCIRQRAKTKKIKCDVCGDVFQKKISFLKQHPGTKFCSRKCMGVARKTGENKNCPVCGKIFYTTRNIYCSHKCASNIFKVDNPKWENEEYVKKYHKKYQKNNRERINGLARIRNKTKKGRLEKSRIRIQRRGQGSLSAKDYEKLIDNSNNVCFWCKKEIEGKIQIDHLIPVSRDGKTELKNLAVTCAFCNQSKGNKLPGEFIKAKRQKCMP